MSIPNSPGIAIVGATGAVGNMLISLIEERQFDTSDVALLASPRSAGRKMHAGGAERTVMDLGQFDFSEIDIAFFSAGGAVSTKHADRAASEGTLVIDNTNAFRMEVDVPLVVPQINAQEVLHRPSRGIIANPNCSTIPLVRLLKPLTTMATIKSVIVSTYQAASGAGLSGIEELRRSARHVLDDEADEGNERFANPLGFNVVPNIDRPMATGFTLEEQKMLQESRKILNLPDLHLSATCVRVPVITAHSETVYIRFDEPIDRERVVATLAETEEVLVHDRGPGQVAYPTPRFLSDPNKVHVGRIRVDPQDPRGLWLWVIADNIRVGAALNAIQIAEKVVQKKVH